MGWCAAGSSVANNGPAAIFVSPGIHNFVSSRHASATGVLECFDVMSKSVGSHGNTGEAYLLASLNSEIAAMLLLREASAESTLAVTSAASCTMRLWLMTPANSRSWPLPVPLEVYSS
jgi:hypothetical protein